MVMIAASFLLTLPFTGLEPLWNTRRATSLLLTAAAALVVLINCAYQEAEAEHPAARILVYARLVAVAVMAIMVGLAAYGLWLRVTQYGLSPQRIIAFACLVVGMCYALGYLIAAARDRTSLRGLEITNIVTAFVICAVLVALLTPIADPARVSVADQVRRLNEGKITPEKFDFAFLRFKGGRYGAQALEALSRHEDGPQATQIAAKAKEAQAWQFPAQQSQVRVQHPPVNRAANITVLTAGQTVPDSFLQKDWTGIRRQHLLPRCLVVIDQKCEAMFVDLDGDGTLEILLLPLPGGIAAAFKSTSDGSWSLLGSIQNIHCKGVREALRAGTFEIAAPELKELEVNSHRLRVSIECGDLKP
jgi:hypothetical protein